jgi:diguanylate cyclase (GGDEF)-like protein
MLSRLKETIRSEKTLAAEIRLPLVDGLFYPFASLIVGALTVLWIAATVTILVEDFWVQFAADFTLVVALARIGIGFRYVSLKRAADRGNVDFWEGAYALGAALFSAGLGVCCMLAILRVETAPLHLMLCTTTAAYAASITGRNAGRPYIAIAQLYLAAGPMCLGLILSPHTFYQVVGVALFLFMFGMTDITLSVRKTIVGALETKQKNVALAQSFESQALLFDAALNNMSHGLAMFDAEGRLLVANRKLATILGCNPAIFEKDIAIVTLVERLRRSAGTTHDPLVDAIRQSFRSRAARQSFVKLEHGKVISVSRQKMDNGNVVVVFEDVTEATKAHERIRQLAWADDLTGLMNRASFKEVFKKTLDVMDEDATVALHLIDLDHFKSVNDTLGHPTGDLLLVEVAKRITAACGDEGVVARLGGDEFVIIQRLVADGETPASLAKRVLDAVCQTFEIHSHRINIGASFGVALAPLHGKTVDVLLKRADMALYKAKAHGRNCIEYFEENLDLMAQQRRSLELDMRAAVERREFTLAFQPIVAVPEREIAAFETLIRWHHPTRGYISPAEFIPVAEETGLILDIGRFVLEEAVREASAWPTDAAVAVNFSAVQFQDRNFPLFLVAVLKRYGLPPARLELEITETALLEDSTSTIEMLEQFRAIGVRISLDDFGTGYSSLSQLRTFPFNKIKIDGSFVRDLGRDPSAVAVIRAVTNIGKILGMTVVAECVEDEEQLNFLVGAGCDQIQGYFTGRPQSAQAVRDLLSVRRPLLEVSLSA